MNNGKNHLVAIQPRVSVEDYLSTDAFESKLASLGAMVEASLQDRERGDVLVVFPEYFASFLALTNEDALKGFDFEGATVDKAIERLVSRRPFALLKAMFDGGTADLNRAVFRMLTPKVHKLIVSLFSSFASRHRATVVAGSALMCPVKPESAHLGEPELLSSEFYNTSYVFGVHGQLLGVYRKVNIVPTQEDILEMSVAPAGEQRPVGTPVGKLGVCICYDGFKVAHSQHEPGFVPLARQYDAEGVDVIAWPSANPWPWNEAWVFGAEPKEKLRCTQWVEEGLEGFLGELEHVQYVINPHLVGNVLDARMDGVSKILVRQGKKVKVLAQAASHLTEEVLVATVDKSV